VRETKRYKTRHSKGRGEQKHETWSNVGRTSENVKIYLWKKYRNKKTKTHTKKRPEKNEKKKKIK
jgi:hypothetical protein